MHGRLKIKTTAQQEAERKAQRQEKLQTYQKAIEAIFANRKAIKADTNPEQKDILIKTQMKLTSGVLMANPDISTLWNIRKQILNDILTVQDNEEEAHDIILRKELDLTVQCLQNNPKSYGAWHHRCWSMLRMLKPHWDYELMLCNKYLSLDERNFHCWDYRRFVVKHAEISAQDELNYTMERININFSNYSAWHYRSKLLPMLDDKISEVKRREELDLVLDAAFTDPEDSSAWFYHKWLLGRPEDILKPVMIRFDTKDNDLMVAFSRPVASKDLRLFVNDKLEHVSEWTSIGNETYQTLWMTKLLNQEGGKIRLILPNNQSIEACANSIIQASSDSLDQDTYGVLEQELENCNKLLELAVDGSYSELLELESDSKWTLYTKVLIMKTMDARKFHAEIVAGFETLCHIDAMRQGYYRDQRSKCIIDKVFKDTDGDAVDLSDSNLTSIYFPEKFAFFRRVNLSRNALKCLKTLKPYLINCEELLVEGNPLEDDDANHAKKVE